MHFDGKFSWSGLWSLLLWWWVAFTNGILVCSLMVTGFFCFIGEQGCFGVGCVCSWMRGHSWFCWKGGSVLMLRVTMRCWGSHLPLAVCKHMACTLFPRATVLRPDVCTWILYVNHVKQNLSETFGDTLPLGMLPHSCLIHVYIVAEESHEINKWTVGPCGHRPNSKNRWLWFLSNMAVWSARGNPELLWGS